VRVSSTAGETNSASAAVTVFPPKTAWLDLRKVDGLSALWIDGALDTPYRVQFSTGLDTWSDLIDLSLLTSPFLFVDPGASSSPSRFYRLRILSDGG
jgi:hypothetical protein